MIQKLPDAKEFESAFIGSLILSPSGLDSVSSVVHPVDLFDKVLAGLYQLMIDLNDAGQPFGDIQLLLSAVRDRGLDIDSARLAQLFTEVPNAGHLVYYANGIKEASHNRKLIALCADIQNQVVQRNPSTDVIESIEAQLTTLTAEQSESAYSMDEVAQEFTEQLESREKRKTILTGVPRLDDSIGGLARGEMVVVAARPGCGKTSLGWQIAEHAGRQLRNVLFVSLEMRRTELFARVVCGLADVDSRAIRRGNLTGEQLEAIKAAANQIAPFPISIADPATATIRQVRGLAKLQKAKIGLDLLVIDYIGLLKTDNPKLPRHEQVSADSKTIKQMAKELDIPVVVLCQLNRDADGSLPRLSQLRESGSIEQDSDIVILLHVDQQETQKQMREFALIIAKNRHGDTGKTSIHFDAAKTRFQEPVYEWKP